MPDLPDLLADEAAQLEPGVAPPFPALVRRARRRRQRRTASAVLASAVAVAGVVVLVNRPQPPRDSVAEPPLPVANRTCRPQEMTLSLVWTKEPSGSLSGTLTATNGTDEACLLLVKPSVSPNAEDGTSLGLGTVVTKEGRYGADALLPGASASAPVSWLSLCGDRKAGRTASVGWEGERRLPAALVTSTGALQPDCLQQLKQVTGQLSSSWFTGLSERRAGDPVKVNGTLSLVGGPAGAPAKPVEGSVTFAPSEPGHGTKVTVTADADGRWAARVEPGTYHVTGTSPRSNGGHGTCIADDSRVYVPAEGLQDLAVTCPIK